MYAGLKLDVKFIDNPQYVELFEGRDVLQTLWDKGIRALETPVGPNTDRMLLSEHIRICTQAGFSVSIHPYTELTEYNPSFFRDSQQNPCRHFHEEIFFIANEAAVLQKNAALVNIHPAADLKTISRKELLDRSVHFYAWAEQWCSEYTPDVRVSAELQIAANPEESMVRVGDTFEELEQISYRSGCGLCWDFGHAYLNNLRFGSSQVPGPELIKRIIHVHCHDVNVDDHWPLLTTTSGWDSKLQMLLESGYDSTVILEIPPKNFLKAGGYSSFEKTVDALFSVARFQK